MFMNRWIALAMKFLSPDMLHVTAVCLPSGLNVNSAVLICANTASGGADMVVLRATRYSFDCRATMTTSTTMITATTMRILISIGILLRSGLGLPDLFDTLGWVLN